MLSVVDTSLSVVVSRTLLSLPDLDINDHLDYIISANQFLGADETWTRNQISSPWIDGSVTVSRTRAMVNQPLSIEVYGDHDADVQAKIKALSQAMSQSDFQLGISIGAAQWQYQCESADRTVQWTTPRIVAHQWIVQFTIPMQPNPVSGGF